MTSHFRLAFVLLGASLVFAAGVMASTNTDNTTVANIVGWEAGPDTRGTLSLVWSCVITIFACTSTVLHLNVPGREDSTSLRVWRKMKWMVITILFPEFIFAKAVCDLRQALAELRDFGDDIQEINGKTKRTVTYKSPAENSYPWTNEFSWDVEYPRYASLLYRLLFLESPTFKQLQPPSGDLQIDTAQEMNSKVWKTVQKWTIFHSYYAQMGGLLVPNWSWEPSYGVLTGTVLNAQLQWSSDSDSPLKHLVLSEKDIQDTSKADWSLKSIAVLQIAWLVLSVAVRALTGLPITQLEIATIAFAIMAILTYVTSWWKPKGVSEPKIVQCVSPDKMRIMYTPRIQYMSLWFWSPARSAEGWQRTDCNKRVPNDAILVKGDTPSITVLLAASSLLFGGLHCLAWNFEFPSRTELTCWRVGCLISAVLPAVTVGISTFLSYLSTKYLNQQCFRIFVKEELKDLPEMPSEWWDHMTTDYLMDHFDKVRESITSMPKTSTYGEVWPSENLDESIFVDLRNYCEDVAIQCLLGLRYHQDLFENDRVNSGGGNFFDECKGLKDLWQENKNFRGFWRYYESSINHKIGISNDAPGPSYIDRLVEAYDRAKPRIERIRKPIRNAPRILSLFSGILYTSSRLLTIILLFTSLRAVPADVYRTTSWVSFLPNIS